MAQGTFLDVTTNSVGTGVALTGDFEVSVTGQHGGGVHEIQRAATDTDADYKPIGRHGQFNGEGHTAVRNVGTNYYRAVLKGATRTAASKSVYSQ